MTKSSEKSRKSSKSGENTEKEPFYAFICSFCKIKLRSVPIDGKCKACGAIIDNTDDTEECEEE